MTIEGLRRMTSPDAFVKGECYFRDHAVLDLAWQDGALVSMVQGSRHQPYEVRICFDSQGIDDAYCSCPVSNPCKHIVAVLLTCMAHPEGIMQRRSLTEVLRELTLERHLQLWAILLEEDPAFSRKLELLLAKEMAPGTPKPEPEKRPAVIDITPFRREAKAITASLRGRYGDGMGEMIYDRLQVLLTRIEPFLDADDGDSALLALREILDAFTYEWIEMDEEGDISILIDEMGEMIAQALLCADPPLPRRQEWLKALRKWHDEMADYGCEEGANVAIRAAEEGWDLPELNAILRGEFSDTDSDAAHPQDPLARIRMRILALRGRHEERLNLARFYGEFGECAQTLLHLGRADEAERIAMTRMTTPMEMQTLAQQFMTGAMWRAPYESRNVAWHKRMRKGNDFLDDSIWHAGCATMPWLLAITPWPCMPPKRRSWMIAKWGIIWHSNVWPGRCGRRYARACWSEWSATKPPGVPRTIGLPFCCMKDGCMRRSVWRINTGTWMKRCCVQ
ncbi:hypothetical protein SIID45300_02234 [Candidatus Magnetaquicoccaceae bacterium FCR-1]|uniref:SWIM-type domain-containing protein n=2 Tax=Candidatus Magnetaquiglobus chichijimensis TaxID=3141448 RepID=A0ABQ0CAI1_9PROT